MATALQPYFFVPMHTHNSANVSPLSDFSPYYTILSTWLNNINPEILSNPEINQVGKAQNLSSILQRDIDGNVYDEQTSTVLYHLQFTFLILFFILHILFGFISIYLSFQHSLYQMCIRDRCSTPAR